VTFTVLYAATVVWSVAAALFQGAPGCHLPLLVAFQSRWCEAFIQALSGQVAPQGCTGNVIRRCPTPCVPVFRQCATGHPVAAHLAKHLGWQRRVNSGGRCRSGSEGVTPPRRHASALRGDGQQGAPRKVASHHARRLRVPVRVCPPRQLVPRGVCPRRASLPVRSGATARCGRVRHCPSGAGGPADVGAPRRGVPRLYRRSAGLLVTRHACVWGGVQS